MIAFYFDVHVPLAIALQLRRRGIDVLRTQEDGTNETPDDELLERATVLHRVMVTQDQDFLAIAKHWQRIDRRFMA